MQFQNKINIFLNTFRSTCLSNKQAGTMLAHVPIDWHIGQMRLSCAKELKWALPTLAVAGYLNLKCKYTFILT